VDRRIELQGEMDGGRFVSSKRDESSLYVVAVERREDGERVWTPKGGR
jgi:hypothetical protein